MTWWQRLFERRTTPPMWQLSELQSWSDMGIGEGMTSAGLTVTATTAMKVPAVYSCVQVLSQDVARTPIKLRRQVAPDTFEDAVDHDLYEVLSSLPNPETTSYTFKQQLMTDVLQHEHAYAEIIRTPDGRVTALWRLDPTLMRVDRDANRRKRWTYGSTSWTFDASRPPIFELQHPSPIQQCRDVIGSSAALQAYVGQFFANGAKPGGVLKVEGAIKQGHADELRKQWLALFSQSGSSRRGVAVLEGGVDFKPVSEDNDSSQMNETLGALNQMIAGIFRVPSWKIGDLTKTSYANMEAGELSYVTSTLDPYFELWESSLRRDVLSTRQYSSYTITFDRSALVRNDVKSLHESLAVGRNTGFYSANDCRKKLGENPIAGGDVYLTNSALQPIGATTNEPPTIA